MFLNLPTKLEEVSFLGLNWEEAQGMTRRNKEKVIDAENRQKGLDPWRYNNAVDDNIVLLFNKTAFVPLDLAWSQSLSINKQPSIFKKWFSNRLKSTYKSGVILWSPGARHGHYSGLAQLTRLRFRSGWGYITTTRGERKKCLTLPTGSPSKTTEFFHADIFPA